MIKKNRENVIQLVKGMTREALKAKRLSLT